MHILLAALQAAARGDFSIRLPAHWHGIEGKLAESFNALMQSNRLLARGIASVGGNPERDGLPMAQETIEMHRVGPGVGEAPAQDDAVDMDVASVSGARVLVVDDNRDAADTLAMMVRLLGHEVTQIYDPQQVEAEVERFDPTVIFLDLEMPGRSGHDIAASLRRRHAGRTLEIVAVTGWDRPEDRERTRASGFDKHVVKPPQLGEIRRICAESLPQARDG